MAFSMSFFLRIAPLFAAAEGLRTRGHDAAAALPTGAHDDYSFNKFMRDFSRSYQVGSEEYTHRAAVFHESLSQIAAINSQTGRSWTAGVYPFMDLTGAERLQTLHGYDLSGVRRSVGPSSQDIQPGSKLSLVSIAATEGERVYGAADESFEAQAPEVRNQGLFCGSCWAFAAVEAVEAQLMQTDAYQKMGDPRLSVQSLLECVTKEQTNCPETGGCKGATPDLAFQLMQDVGVPLESDLPYKSHPVDAKCPLRPYPKEWMRATLTGWKALPSNKAQPLMQAMVHEGPVVVAADSHDWYPYKSGVFDGCPRDAIPNHSVLAKGYGASDGQKYWLIQNTWGAKWGEEGSIRLLRHDDEDQWCGSDSQPQEATGLCDAGAGQNITVCGTCGLLFDPIIPQGVDISSSTDARREFGLPAPSATLVTDAMDSIINAPSGADAGEAPDQDSGLADETSHFRQSKDAHFAGAVDEPAPSPAEASPGLPSAGRANALRAEDGRSHPKTAPTESGLSKFASDFIFDGSKDPQPLDDGMSVSQPRSSATLGAYFSNGADPLLTAASSWQTAQGPRSEVRDSSSLTSSRSSFRASNTNSESDGAMEAYVGTTTTTTGSPQPHRIADLFSPPPIEDPEASAAHRIADLFR